MSELWSVPGYEVQSLVAGGSAGDLWSAVDVTTGEAVALRRLGGGVDVERLRRTVALQADLPYVVRLREVVQDGPLVVLVLDAPTGGCLEDLLSRRGALDPGEVVTVGVPLCEALAAAHARGLVHGELTTASVQFTADGMPLLAGLGLRGDAGAPGDDVAALAELCASLLVPGTGADVRGVLDAVADPRGRVDARELGERLRQACPPAPVRLRAVVTPGAAQAGAGPAPRERPRSARRPRSRPSSGVVVCVGLVLLVVAGAAAGWWSGRGGEHPEVVAGVSQDVPAAAAPTGAAAGSGFPAALPAPRATPSAAARRTAPPVPTDRWARVLDELDAVRAAAFAQADAEALAAVYAPSSAGLAVDRRRVAALAAARQTAHDVRHVVQAVDVVAADDERAHLRVVDRLRAYEVRDATGAAVARRPERGEAVYDVRLVRTSDGWRLVDVRPA